MTVITINDSLTAFHTGHASCAIGLLCWNFCSGKSTRIWAFI